MMRQFSSAALSVACFGRALLCKSHEAVVAADLAAIETLYYWWHTSDFCGLAAAPIALRRPLMEKSCECASVEGGDGCTQPTHWSFHCSPQVMQPVGPPRILVSSCLLGHNVTFRGRSAVPSRVPTNAALPSPPPRRLWPFLFMRDALQPIGLIEMVPLCPEMVFLGLPAPRPSLFLSIGDNSGGDEHAFTQREEHLPSVRMLETATKKDHTSRFAEGAAGWLRQVQTGSAGNVPPFHGFVGKRRSPSCGAGDARLYCDASPSIRGAVFRQGDGLFVSELRRRIAPSFPIATEHSLGEAAGSAGMETHSLLHFLRRVLASWHDTLIS